MKRIVLSSTFLIACLLGACSNEVEVVCDVEWSTADDMQLGTGTIIYQDTSDVDGALEDCKRDQETDDQRPANAAKFTCNCSN